MDLFCFKVFFFIDEWCVKSFSASVYLMSAFLCMFFFFNYLFKTVGELCHQNVSINKWIDLQSTCDEISNKTEQKKICVVRIRYAINFNICTLRWKCHTWNHGQFLNIPCYGSLHIICHYDFSQNKLMHIWRYYYWIGILSIVIRSKICKKKSILDHIGIKEKKTRLIG